MVKYNKLGTNSRNNRDHSKLNTKNKEILEKIKQLLSEVEDISKQDILRYLAEEEEQIPISIFKSKLSPLEAVTQYLVEEGNSLRETAVKLNRDERTIWTTYENAKKKKVHLHKKSKFYIPLKRLANRKLSILENICIHLKKQGFANQEICKILGRNSQTIWITIRRAENKLK